MVLIGNSLEATNFHVLLVSFLTRVKRNLTVEVKNPFSHIPPGIISCTTSSLPPILGKSPAWTKPLWDLFHESGAFLGAYFLGNGPLKSTHFP